MNDTKFQAFLNLQLKSVFNYLLKIGATKEDAEDIDQETALKYIEHIEAISPDKVKSWLFRVAINRFYDLLRRNSSKRKAFLQLEIIDTNMIEMPEEYLIRKEMNNEVMNILDKLSPRYKDLLVLKYVLNLRYKDIAQLYEINVGTVKTSIFRAKDNFIKLYKEEENGQK